MAHRVDPNLQSFRLGTLPYADALLLDACFVGDRVLLLLKASSGPRYVMQQDPSMDLRFLAISPTRSADFDECSDCSSVFGRPGYQQH